MLRLSRLTFIALVAPAALAACGYVPRIPGVTPYKIEIQQGNQVTQEMVAQLKPGMTKEQVRFVLGTPLLTDIFHGERWDYVFWREEPSGKREQRKLVVYFADGKLTRLDGDVVAAAAGTKQEEARQEERK
jgi:outer membrane protein assembly factor BamE